MNDILDIKQSIINANGNVGLAKDLFQMLLDELPERLDQVNLSYQTGNFEDLLEHAHKIYGATAYCAVPAIRKAAEDLEATLKKAETTDLEVLVNELTCQIKHLILKGQEFLDQNWN